MFHATPEVPLSVHELQQSDLYSQQMSLAQRWPALHLNDKRHRTYRKEIERFVLWVLSEGKTLLTVTSAETTAYRTFLATLSASSDIWVVTPSRPRVQGGQLNPAWRPFAGALKQSSIKQAGAILHGFFEFLVGDGHCSANPWKRSRRIRREHTAREEPFPDIEPLFVAVFDFCRKQCSAEGASIQKAAIRDFWLLAATYLTGLSLTELVSLRMSDLFRNQAGWWLKLGASDSAIVAAPIGPELLLLMRQYRVSIALSELPVAGELDVPLVGDTRSGTRSLSKSAAYKIVREVFKSAALVAPDDDIADELRNLTPTRFLSYALRGLRKRLNLTQGSKEFREALRGVPSLALMRLTLHHPLPH